MSMLSSDLCLVQSVSKCILYFIWHIQKVVLAAPYPKKLFRLRLTDTTDYI